ncbi:MAG: cation:proton antiporter [Gemmatimonadota bacterium]|nr:MAG: cation:proton antiporter [Gemmatimonadota bacterium]
MDLFSLLLDIVLALGAALTLGLLLARLGQSPIVGYLLAGVLIGPNGLAMLKAAAEVRSMADLGVALLLFTIGLELPWRRLQALGSTGIAAGSLQIVLTALATVAVAGLAGVPPEQAILFGMILAFSSTAVVFRVLADRAEIDSVPGRVSVGILLVQDIVVIPFMLIVPALAGAGLGGAVLRDLGVTFARGALLILGLFVLARVLLPLLLSSAAVVRNRELFVILALVFCLGATWAAHALGLSEILGSFVAGVLLADSKFASQIRAEIGSLRAGFLALFFVSIGMLADPAWVVGNLDLVGALIAAIVLGKAIVAAGVVRLLRYPAQVAIIAGWTLAHIGELSFVIAEEGWRHQLIDADAFRLFVSSAVLTLILAPYLITIARRLAELRPDRRVPPAESGEEAAPISVTDHVIIVGYGPTGRRVARALRDVGTPFLVLDLNPRTAQRARAEGIDVEFGDASQEEVLRHAALLAARALVVTVPDPADSATIISTAKLIRPDLLIVARGRYAQHTRRLLDSGAEILLNEEELMGEHLAAVSLKMLGLAAEGVARVEPPGGTDPTDVGEEVVAD